MKNKKTIIVVSAVVLVAVAFSLIVYFDLCKDLSWISFIVWISGTIFLLKQIANNVKKSMPKIAEYTANDIFSSVGTIGIMFAIIFAPIMTSGLGSFQIWYIGLSKEPQSMSALLFVVEYVCIFAAIVIGMAPVIYIAILITCVSVSWIADQLLSGDGISTSAETGAEFAIFAFGFMLLSQFCGAIDYFGFWDEPIRNLVSKLK